MRIRGYVHVGFDGDSKLDIIVNQNIISPSFVFYKSYTFELDVPHPLPELKVIAESVEEVKSEPINS